MATEHESMVEGEEPPPRGVKIMAWFRWGLLGAAAFLAVFSWWSYARAQLRDPAGSAMQAAKYHCPMHPQIVSNEPGECPICHMTLELTTPSRAAPAPSAAAATPTGAAVAPRGTTPATVGPPRDVKGSAAPMRSTVAPGSVPPGTTAITLTLDRIQSIGVRTVVVGEESSSKTLRVTAVVTPTEQGVAEVHVRTPGFVERLLVNQTGIAVGRQQPLFTVYSPEIFQAESELLAAHQWTNTDSGPTTADASRRKLELLGMSAKDIDDVLKKREPMRAVPVYAPQGGYITKKNLVVGSYVTPEMALYEIQDLSRVYVVADVFQRDIEFLQKGTVGRFTPSHRADQAIDVRVDLVYPTLNAEARTTRVRMQVKNAKGLTFRPGEYGAVEFATPGRKALTVPRDAVVDTGLSTHVFLVEHEGTFSPREVALGEEQGDMVTIVAGVSAGDRVVSGATFLIDSESRLQASASQTAMTPPAGPAKPLR